MELVYDNQVIKMSNLLTLMKNAIGTSKDKPIGYKYFYKTLSMTNIPENMIKNQFGLKLLKFFKDKISNKCRPPGALRKSI